LRGKVRRHKTRSADFLYQRMCCCPPQGLHSAAHRRSACRENLQELRAAIRRHEEQSASLSRLSEPEATEICGDILPGLTETGIFVRHLAD
jgi:hypothetical protein